MKRASTSVSGCVYSYNEPHHGEPAGNAKVTPSWCQPQQAIDEPCRYIAGLTGRCRIRLLGHTRYRRRLAIGPGFERPEGVQDVAPPIARRARLIGAPEQVRESTPGS